MRKLEQGKVTKSLGLVRLCLIQPQVCLISVLMLFTISCLSVFSVRFSATVRYHLFVSASFMVSLTIDDATNPQTSCVLFIGGTEVRDRTLGPERTGSGKACLRRKGNSVIALEELEYQAGRI